MKPLYAKLTHSLKCFFLMTATALLLTACSGGGGYSGSTPWGMDGSQSVVSQDPSSQPDIAWQTSHQRRTLADDAAAQAQTMDKPAQKALANSRKVTVAMLLPLTGQHAELGQAMLKAAQMALFDVGSASFELVPHDTRSTTAGAADAARRAAANGTDLVLGPIFSEDVKAAKPFTSSANIPMIAFTTDWKLADRNTYIMGFLPFAQVARVTQYAQSKGLSQFATYAPQTEYCDVVIGTLQRTGARIVRVGRFAPGTNEMPKLVEEFATQNRTIGADGQDSFAFDTLLLPVGGESLRAVVSLLDINGITNEKIRLIGTGLWDDESLTQNPGLFGGWFAAPDPALRVDFEKRYQQNYGSVPPRLTTLAYDATALSAVLSRSGAGNGDTYSRTRLTNPRGFAGVDGVFRFRTDGLSERGLAVLEIQSGRARVVDPAPTAFVASGS